MSEFSKTSEDRLSSEEVEKKAESLFSDKFREYLNSKKSESNEPKSSISTFLVKEYTASSSETTASESSRKSGRKVRKKLKERKTHWDIHYAFRNRLTQCNLLKTDESVSPPENLKPLLLNLTILLQDLKQSPSEYENLYNLISKFTILVTEFVRRPLKKIQDDNGEHSKKVEKTIEMMMNLIQEYKNDPNLELDNSIREYKRLEKDLAAKNQKIAEAKKKLTEDRKSDLRIREPILRVKNSIVLNEKLKSDIKFNQSHVKKYKKVLVEKEWTKRKLETELAHLKKKISKVDLEEGEDPDKHFSKTSELSLKSDGSYTPLQRTKNRKIKKK